MTISYKVWANYIEKLRKINETASWRMIEYLKQHPDFAGAGQQAAIDVAFALATRYGEAATALACEMYDALAAASGMSLPAALPAATATMHEVAQAVVGTSKSGTAELVANSVGRLVKMAGVDSTMQNAIRDGAEWAWIPQGETCAFCLMLASNGWQRASKKALKGGHAEHIHANCDCTYAIRFDARSNVAGYQPERYQRLYADAEGRSWEDKLNAMRRDQYAENREEIRAQQREAYAERVARDMEE